MALHPAHLTTPAVTEFCSCMGEPTATTQSPAWRAAEEPSATAGSGTGESICAGAGVR